MNLFGKRKNEYQGQICCNFSQILEKSYIFTLQKLGTAVTTISFAHDFLISHATIIKDVSWNKMNQILSTHYGTVAITSLDNTAFLAEMLIDKYFPPLGEEKFPGSLNPWRKKNTLGRYSFFFYLCVKILFFYLCKVEKKKCQRW